MTKGKPQTLEQAIQRRYDEQQKQAAPAKVSVEEAIGSAFDKAMKNLEEQK